MKKTHHYILNGKLNLKKECDLRNLNYRIVHYRINAGWTLEEALNTPINHKKKFIVDGVEISPSKAASDAGLSHYLVKKYITGGCSLEEALAKIRTRLLNKAEALEKKDKKEFKGRYYKQCSIKEKLVLTEECKKWNISYSTVMKRLERGLSLKDALETPVLEHRKKDHLKKKVEAA